MYATLLWNELTTTVRHLQLENFDIPWRLDGAAKTRLDSRPATSEFRRIEDLWKCAKCFTTDGNSGPATPVNIPKTDGLRVAELLKTKPSKTMDTQNVTMNSAF